MILFTFKEEPETRGTSYSSAFRWSFQIEWNHIGFVHQCQDRKTQEWHDSGCTRYDMWLTKRFRIGSYHTYYDGPNCMFQLGWIQFCWSNDNCKKCWG